MANREGRGEPGPVGNDPRSWKCTFLLDSFVYASSPIRTSDTVTTRGAAIFIFIYSTCTASVVIASWGKVTGVTSGAITCVLRIAIHNALIVAVTGYTGNTQIVIARVVAGRVSKIDGRPCDGGVTNVTLLRGSKMRC